MVIEPPPPDRMRAVDEVGRWWLPSDPDCRAHGTLTFDGRARPSLALFGVLGDLTWATEADFASPIVLGVTTRGVHVTLIGCRTIESNTRLDELRASKLEVTYVVIGAHFDTREAVRFQTVAVTYDHLDEWVQLSGLRSQHDSSEDGRLLKYTIEYTFPETYTATVGDLTVQVAPMFYRHGEDRVREEITQTMSVEVTPREPLTLDQYLREFFHLQNFLTLAAAAPLYPVGVRAHRALPADPEDPEAPADEHERRVAERQWVEIFYSARGHDAPHRTRRAHQMLFTLRDLGGDFGRYLAAWFALRVHLGPVFNLYIATRYGSGMYMETLFLCLAQAAESYHRRTDKRQPVDKPTFRKMRKRICDVIDDPAYGLSEEVRTLLGRHLMHFNSFSLVQRLTEVVAWTGGLAAAVIPDTTAFANAVKDTRNYLTHWDKPGPCAARSLRAVYHLAEQLRFLLEVSFLREIGMPPTLQETLVRRHQHYHWVVSELATGATDDEPDDAPNE